MTEIGTFRALLLCFECGDPFLEISDENRELYGHFTNDGEHHRGHLFELFFRRVAVASVHRIVQADLHMLVVHHQKLRVTGALVVAAPRDQPTIRASAHVERPCGSAVRASARGRLIGSDGVRNAVAGCPV